MPGPAPGATPTTSTVAIASGASADSADGIGGQQRQQQRAGAPFHGVTTCTPCRAKIALSSPLLKPFR
ncbi:hypothetical protein LP420_14560 [Massilia sp. B-10]|nr:hypothetical protein LP420_14560 [Massilia sp. B-10]